MAQSLNIGIPPVQHFSKKNYGGGTQNWDMVQDGQGRIYVANNEGLLQYDGTRWSLFPVSNNTIVRTVFLSESGRIYVGAQSEFGYFKNSTMGQLEYVSLRHLVPEAHQNFADIWNIIEVGGTVFFRWDNAVFSYKNETVKVHEFEKPVRALIDSPFGLLAQLEYDQFLKWDGTSFTPFAHTPNLQSQITAIIVSDTASLLVSLKNGLFELVEGRCSPYPTPHDALLKEQRMSDAQRLKNGSIAVASSLGGLYIFDGTMRLMHHFHKGNCLQNNNILCLMEERGGTLWLGLNNGLDCVDMASPFTNIYPDADLEGTGYAALIADNQFYLGVSNGVYTADWRTYFDPKQGSFFKKIQQTDGQVWNLQSLNSTTFLGHHEGPFVLNNQNATSIGDGLGFWKYLPMSDRYVLAGTYEGLVLFEKNGNTWSLAHRFSELEESCRIMVHETDGTVWVSHPYRGVFRVLWSEEKPKQLEVEFYDAKSGLPSNLNNAVFSIAGKAVFGTEKGVFRFDARTKQFARDSLFSKALGEDRRINLLQEDQKGNIWYAAEKEVGILQVEDFGLSKSFVRKEFPALNDRLVGGFETVFPYDEHNVFFGAERGFIHFNPKKIGGDTTLNLLLSAVTVHLDSIIYGGYGTSDEVELSKSQNTVSFSFSTTNYQLPKQIEYRYRLLGLDKNWSKWNSHSQVRFEHLADGDYTFEVEARRGTVLSNRVQYPFTILPPWYASNFAKIIYALLFGAALFGFSQRQKSKFEKEKTQLTELHQQREEASQQAVKETQAALVKAQNEKLQTEIQARNQELALATMHLVQKGEMLTGIREGLDRIKENSKDERVKKEVRQLINLLNINENLEDDWEQFAIHFDQVHVDFLKRLREHHPNLSPNDYKLCAFLRMNLSTKEIATMMNISVRGAEASRYRLRKRLGLDTDVNLNDFIMDI